MFASFDTYLESINNDLMFSVHVLFDDAFLPHGEDEEPSVVNDFVTAFVRSVNSAAT